MQTVYCVCYWVKFSFYMTVFSLKTTALATICKNNLTTVYNFFLIAPMWKIGLCSGSNSQDSRPKFLDAPEIKLIIWEADRWLLRWLFVETLLKQCIKWQTTWKMRSMTANFVGTEQFKIGRDSHALCQTELAVISKTDIKFRLLKPVCLSGYSTNGFNLSVASYPVTSLSRVMSSGGFNGLHCHFVSS